MSKPRIRASSLPWLTAIDDAIRRHDIRGESLYQTASDVLDGWAERRELVDLCRRRLLTIVRNELCDIVADRGREICGNYYSVLLTDRAIRAFWPDRAATA